MHIPLNEAQISAGDFDFDLNFLQGYVQQQIGQGKKEYDNRRRQIESSGYDIVQSKEKGLNYQPYATPGFSRVNTEHQASNPLYSQATESQPKSDEGLQITGLKKVWGSQPPQN